LIEALVPEGGAVADPFAGSGSLGDAAVVTGRRAWLSDADARFADTMRIHFAKPTESPPDTPLRPLPEPPQP
jgi:DNA modification methylase